MKSSSKNQKNVDTLDKNHNQVFSSKNLIDQIKDIQKTKLKKDSKAKQTIIHKMKNEGFVK